MTSCRIKGITIEIDGDTTKLGKALESAEGLSKKLQGELKGINILLKLDPSNVELLTQKQKVLTDSIIATEDKLNTLKSAQAKVQEQFDKAILIKGNGDMISMHGGNSDREMYVPLIAYYKD